MKAAPPPPGHPAVLQREPPPVRVPGGDHGFTPRGTTERPASLRDTLVRWLNEEL